MRPAFIVAIVAAFTLVGCADEPSGTENQFREEFQWLTSTEQEEMCYWFYYVTESEFDRLVMSDEVGLTQDEAINLWNALVEEC